MSLPLATDVTAQLFKILQSQQIQSQLDSVHNFHKCNDDKIENKKGVKKSRQSSTIAKKKKKKGKLKNLDKDLSLFSSQICSLNQMHFKKKTLSLIETNSYSQKLLDVYDNIKTLMKNGNSIEKINLEMEVIYKLMYNPLDPVQDLGKDFETNPQFIKDTMYITNLSNFIDLRKSKIWVMYLLSDMRVRYGTMHYHPIFNKLPGWLFDVIWICSKHNLYLIYSTDMRGVSQFMDQLCSLLNIHHLISLDLETPNLNYTSILIHLVGILSCNSLNPINRQGMKFPSSILQKTTFENVRNQFVRISKKTCNDNHDSLTSFISTIIMCLKHKTGTNAFNIVMK